MVRHSAKRPQTVQIFQHEGALLCEGFAHGLHFGVEALRAQGFEHCALGEHGGAAVEGAGRAVQHLYAVLRA